jgi:RNA polymerase sigma-70 factor, ECF subfamily
VREPTWLLHLTARDDKSQGSLRATAGQTSNEQCNRPGMAAQTRHTSEALRRSSPAPALEHREIVDLTGADAKCVRMLAEIVRMPGTTVKTRVLAARRTMAELVQAAGIERGWP